MTKQSVVFLLFFILLSVQVFSQQNCLKVDNGFIISVSIQYSPVFNDKGQMLMSTHSSDSDILFFKSKPHISSIDSLLMQGGKPLCGNDSYYGKVQAHYFDENYKGIMNCYSAWQDSLVKAEDFLKSKKVKSHILNVRIFYKDSVMNYFDYQKSNGTSVSGSTLSPPKRSDKLIDVIIPYFIIPLPNENE